MAAVNASIGFFGKGDELRARFARQRREQHLGIQAWQAPRRGLGQQRPRRLRRLVHCARAGSSPGPESWLVHGQHLPAIPPAARTLIMRDVLGRAWSLFKASAASVPATGGDWRGGLCDAGLGEREERAKGMAMCMGVNGGACCVASILLTLDLLRRCCCASGWPGAGPSARWYWIPLRRPRGRPAIRAGVDGVAVVATRAGHGGHGRMARFGVLPACC